MNCHDCLLSERKTITLIDDPRVLKLAQTISMDAMYRVTWDFLDPPELRGRASIAINELEKMKNWQVTRSNSKPLPDNLDECLIADACNEKCLANNLPLIKTREVEL